MFDLETEKAILETSERVAKSLKGKCLEMMRHKKQSKPPFHKRNGRKIFHCIVIVFCMGTLVGMFILPYVATSVSSVVLVGTSVYVMYFESRKEKR